jgi:hypothetical protein
MRRIAVCFFVGLLLFAIPSISLGQGFLASIGDAFASQGCGDKPFLIPPTVKVGYAVHRKGLGLSDDLGVDFSHPFQGLWLEATAGARPARNIGVVVGGAYLFPENGSGVQRQNTHFEEASSQLWHLEALGNLAVYRSSPVELIGGFRWLQFQNRIRMTDDATNSITRFNVKANAYIPLVGMQLHYPGLTARIMGFPWVPANLTTMNEDGDYLAFDPVPRSHYTPERSLFLELAAEYSVNLYAGAALGVFGKYTTYQAQFKGRDVSQQMFAPFTRTSLPVNITTIIQHWTLGGSVSVDFSIPYII